MESRETEGEQDIRGAEVTPYITGSSQFTPVNLGPRETPREASGAGWTSGDVLTVALSGGDNCKVVSSFSWNFFGTFKKCPAVISKFADLALVVL